MLDHNRRIPLYLTTVFCAMEEGTNTVETCHSCFLRRASQEQRAFSFRKLAYHGPKCPDPPYHGHLIFKEFGLMVDSNAIDTVGKTSVDVHGLGREKGDKPLIVGEKVKCNMEPRHHFI